MTHLLAKSRRGTRELTLERHLRDTEQAATSLFREGSRWAEAFLRFFRLAPTVYPRFLIHLRIAALFHDIGKANEGFQQALRARDVVQPLRHEHLSALVLAHPPIQEWLAHAAALDQDVVLAAVLSHHLKAAEDGQYKVMASRRAGAIVLCFADPQVTAILARIADVLKIEPLALNWPGRYREDDDTWGAAYEELWARADRFQRALQSDRERLALNLAVKAAVIAADSIASAMFREDMPIDDWLEGVAHLPPLAPDAVEQDILLPRIEEIRGRTGTFDYQEFQHGAARVGPRGLLLAACGAGKTLAAWRWADAVARTQPIGRVIFLYPTRGTATEGFRDYVGHAPEGSAALLHGTAKYELTDMAQNPGDTLPASLKGKNVLPDEAEARLFALGLWSKRYFSATVDQFLSFVEHSYSGLCLVPALADAAIVLDEVHSYDRSMWNALVAFLSHFDVPVLCMTATLPADRRRALERLGLRMYPDASERAALADLEAAEALPRYRIEAISGEVEAMRIVEAASKQGKRVLWVVNTVARCQRVAKKLRDEVGLDALVYHSRFTLEDRKQRHRETVDAFRPEAASGASASIAVTTQVCEMSLDLDADVLITEHAPISSLVQRFGRAHRHHREGRCPAQVFTYVPERLLPYDRREIDPVEAFLTELVGRDCSQRQLAEGLERHAPREVEPSRSSRFTRGGFFATPGSLRDLDGEGAVALLSTDVAKYLEMSKRGDPTDGLRLNVPKKFAAPDPDGRLPPWLLVADAERYERWRGFLVDEAPNNH